MKFLWTVLLMIPFLTGCKSSELDKAMELRAQLLKAESCAFDAQVTADYGDRLYSFSMDCQGDSQGDLCFTVTQPESIAGISGSIRNARGVLTFDDTTLEFPLLADDSLTPVSAPWILLKTLRSGYITSVGTEGGRIRLSIDDSFDDDALRLDIWLEEETRPVQADILYRGQKILSLEVSDFRTESNPAT